MMVHHLGDIWEFIGIYEIYGDLWWFMVIYRMFHDVFKKSSEHDWTSETSDYINTQKNDRQSKIPNLFF